MKVIIEGKLYDTEKATLLAKHLDRDKKTLDIGTRLFKTKQGYYFLHSVAGKFVRRGNRFVVLNEQIFPNEGKELSEWCRAHAPEVADQHFGGLIQDA